MSSDEFRFYIDPYCDRRTGYYFAINAAKVLVDQMTSCADIRM